MNANFRPINVKRPALSHRLEVWSPKLRRRLTFYCRDTLSLWALLEANPRVATFCERPGYVRTDERTLIADFWLMQDGDVECWALDEAPILMPFDDETAPTLDDIPVRVFTTKTIEAQALWISNWLRMLPYITSNSRFLDHCLFARVRDALNAPQDFYGVERALRPTDPVLVRSAIFELMRTGQICADSLKTAPLHPRMVITLCADMPDEA